MNDMREVLRLLRKISDLAYDEDVGEPLDCAIDYANKAIAALAATQVGIAAQVLDDLANGRFEYMGDAVSAARKALAATPAVGILSREKSDRLLSECGYEPATPAVGGEPVAWRSRHSARIWTYHEDKLTGPSAHLFETQPLYAAQPASPLRGRELLEAALKCIDFDGMDPNTFTIAELRRAL
jgi:hypothetical protein